VTQIPAFQQQNQPAKEAIIMCLPKKMKHKFEIFLFLSFDLQTSCWSMSFNNFSQDYPIYRSVLQHQSSSTPILETQPSVRRYTISHLTRGSNIPKLHTKANYEYSVESGHKECHDTTLEQLKTKQACPYI
jgi:hypothetical protein